jgi:hypothetical protein
MIHQSTRIRDTSSLTRHAIPLPLLLRLFGLLLVVFRYTLALSSIKTNDSLDKVMVREFSIRFCSILYVDLSIEDEAWIYPSAFNQLLKDRLVFTQRNNSSFDALRLEPGLGKWNLKNTFLLLRCGRTCNLCVSFI